MSNTKSQAWKDLERSAADALNGKRITTPWQLFHERPDVTANLPDGRRLVIECKYRTRFAHHGIIDDCQARYCQGNDIPVLVTKHHNQVGAYATIPLSFLADMLENDTPKHNDSYRTLKSKKTYSKNKDNAQIETDSAENKGNRRISQNEGVPMDNEYRAMALQICSAIGSNNIDDMAAVLAATPEADRRVILDMAQTLNRLEGKRN